MATLVAVTILGSVFLPRDIGPINEAFEHRAEERILATQNWEREFYPTLESSPPHRAHRVVVSGGVEQWRGLVEQYFRPDDVPWAMAVMQCESGGDPDAKNPNSSASGIFQHLASLWPARSEAAGWAGADIFDPVANVAVAAWLVEQKGGRGHWTCTKKVSW